MLRDRKFADSPLERDGFEPSVPRRKRRGAYRRYKDLLVRRGPLERWYDFYNNAEEGFAGVVRGETCLRSCTRSRVRASSSSRRIRRALLAGAAFDYQNAREGMDRDRRQQWPRRGLRRRMPRVALSGIALRLRVGAALMVSLVFSVCESTANSLAHFCPAFWVFRFRGYRSN